MALLTSWHDAQGGEASTENTFQADAVARVGLRRTTSLAIMQTTPFCASDSGEKQPTANGSTTERLHWMPRANRDPESALRGGDSMVPTRLTPGNNAMRPVFEAGKAQPCPVPALCVPP